MRTKHKMTDEFECKGNWWLPDAPTIKVSGVLKFTPDEGAILDLQGNFQNTDDINNISAAKVILGSSFDGKNISLHGCYPGYHKHSFHLLPGGYGASWLFNIEKVFIGAHFPEKEGVKFKTMCVQYSHLDEWAGISGFDIPDPDFVNKEMVIKYKLPDPISANIDGYKISIWFIVTPPSLPYLQKEVTIKQRVCIKIESSGEKLLSEYLKVIYHIRDFLSLGIMGPVYPLFVEGETELVKETKGKVTYYPPIRIYYKQMNMPKAFRDIIPERMHFTFGDIRDRFESFLQNWFKKINLLEPVYDLYFGALYDSPIYLNKWFLDLIYAIESFHRLNGKGYYLSEAEYKPINDALVQHIPPGVNVGLRGRLKSQIKYAREISLRKRLEEICESHQKVLNSIIHDHDKFINDVVNTRNYLTHYDAELKDDAVTGDMLFFRIKEIKIMIEVCLLTEIGFTQDEILGLFGRCRKRDREFMTGLFN